MGEPEPRREEPNNEEGNPYLFLALGIGLIVAAAMIVATTGAAITGFPFVIGAAALLGIGVNEVRKQRASLPQPVNGERELLSAIREAGGSITPAEAAMETSLTVSEADRMLSELASAGHLRVESEEGALYYVLHGRRGLEIGG